MEDRFMVRVWDIKREMYVYDAQFEPNYDVIEDDTEYIPEQCTGCRDCSNQLVYEGDILEIAEDMGTSHVVVHWDNEFQKWAVEGDTEADYEFYDLVKRPCDTNEPIDDVGVVGNIHENLNLLKNNQC